MPARLLDGVTVAADIRAEVRPAVDAFTARAGRPPGLGIILVGDNPGSEIYVRNKLKSAGEAGLRTDLERLPANASLAELLGVVDQLNRSDVHDGILVQSPLPEAMGHDAERRVFDAVRADKDVDGFHPINVGLLVQNRATLVACTPSGVIELLERSRIAIAGTRAVVIGRSDIVGKPMALLLLHRHATVTVCHSRTADLPRFAAEADILVAAIGRPAFVTKAFVKPGATVVDVGINRVTDRAAAEGMFPPGSKGRADFERRGSVVVGDVHPEVAEVAGALTPVPGGVGPLTIAMLLRNTLRAAEARLPAGKGPQVVPAGVLSHRPRETRTMQRVALTGGIATGKSYVAEQFRRRGVPCLDADALAHGVMSPGTEATTLIAARFGAHVLAPDGAVDRATLGPIVFADPAARRELEAIVHPAVYRAIAAGLRGFERLGTYPIAIADIPLLYETGAETQFDRIVVAACRPETQLARLVERGLSEADAQQRIAAQWPTDAKAAKADFVINTDGTFEETDRQVEEVYRALRSEPS